MPVGLILTGWRVISPTPIRSPLAASFSAFIRRYCFIDRRYPSRGDPGICNRIQVKALRCRQHRISQEINAIGALRCQRCKPHHFLQRAVLIQLAVVIGVVHHKAVAQMPAQSTAPGPAIQAVEISATGVVVIEAVPVFEHKAHGGIEATGAFANLTNRVKIDISLQGAGAVIANTYRNVGGKFTQGLAGNHIQRTRRGVAAIERALRPAQNLDALDLGNVHGGTQHFADIHTVDIHAHRRVQRNIIGAASGNATNAHAQGASRTGNGCTAHTGNGAKHIFCVSNAAFLDGIAGQCGNGDRRILQGFDTSLGGDQNFFQHLCRRAQRLGNGQGDGDRQRCPCQPGQCVHLLHASTPLSL